MTAPFPSSAGRLGRLCCLVALAGPLLGGCAMSIPIASLVPHGDDVTGSNSPVPFGRMLDEEGRRREMAALATALDPQGDGSLVKWESGRTKDRGTLIADGKPFTRDGKVCRGFHGDLTQADRVRAIGGVACMVSAGNWSVVEEPAHGRG